jgi:hypothetical protein
MAVGSGRGRTRPGDDQRQRGPRGPDAYPKIGRGAAVLVVALCLLLVDTSAAVGQRHGRDLVVQAVSEPPARVVPGESFTAEDVVVNEGRPRAAASWTGYYVG